MGYSAGGLAGNAKGSCLGMMKPVAVWTGHEIIYPWELYNPCKM